MRKVKALFINSNERETEEEMQEETENKGEGEQSEGVFWKEHRIVKPSHFS